MKKKEKKEKKKKKKSGIDWVLLKNWQEKKGQRRPCAYLSWSSPSRREDNTTSADSSSK